MITDGESEVKEADQIEAISDQLLQSDTSVNVIAVDFCRSLDEDSDEEPKPENGLKDDGEGDDEDDNKPNEGKFS